MATQGTIQLTQPVSERDHTRGPHSAEVSLVEYGDFECPYCRAAEPIVAGLIEALGDRLSVTFRHFPLSQVHSHAGHAAEVAEAAAAQGKFWEMHDILFARQDALDDADLLKYAAELSLDSDRVSRELAGHEYARRVEEDQQSGLDSSAARRPSTSMAPGTTVPSRSATCSPRSVSCTPISSLATQRPPTQEFPASDGPARSGRWPGDEIDCDRQRHQVEESPRRVPQNG
jgi:hypothetical protein